MALTCSISVQRPGLVTQLLITAKMLNQLKMFDAVFIIPAMFSHPFSISSNYLSCSACLGRAQILSFLLIRMQENQNFFGTSTKWCYAKAQIPSCIQAQTAVRLVHSSKYKQVDLPGSVLCPISHSLFSGSLWCFITTYYSWFRAKVLWDCVVGSFYDFYLSWECGSLVVLRQWNLNLHFPLQMTS